VYVVDLAGIGHCHRPAFTIHDFFFYDFDARVVEADSKGKTAIVLDSNRVSIQPARAVAGAMTWAIERPDEKQIAVTEVARRRRTYSSFCGGADGRLEPHVTASIECRAQARPNEAHTVNIAIGRVSGFSIMPTVSFTHGAGRKVPLLTGDCRTVRSRGRRKNERKAEFLGQLK